MTKRRRAPARPVRKKPRKPVSRLPARRPRPAPRADSVKPPERLPDVPVQRAGYLEAVALYEQGLQALQQHDYQRASGLLQSVIAGYPDEKELLERVRLYLSVCERQMAPRTSAPRNAGERVYAATLAVNAGNYDGALEHLGTASAEDPGNDHVFYMLAIVHALRCDPDSAMPCLLRAIALNPENRALARQDPDLEGLRDREAFRAAVETTPAARSDRRRSARARTPR